MPNLNRGILNTLNTRCTRRSRHVAYQTGEFIIRYIKLWSHPARAPATQGEAQTQTPPPPLLPSAKLCTSRPTGLQQTYAPSPYAGSTPWWSPSSAASWSCAPRPRCAPAPRPPQSASAACTAEQGSSAQHSTAHGHCYHGIAFCMHNDPAPPYTQT